MKKEKIIHERIPVACRLRSVSFFENSLLLEDHFHAEVELVYVEEGNIACRVSGRDFPLREGELLLIGRCAVHKLKYAGCDARVSYIQINLNNICDALFPDSSLFSYFCDEGSQKYAVFRADSDILPLFTLMKKELTLQDIHSDTAIRGCALQLVAFMSREGLIEDASLLIANSAYQKILPAIYYAQRRYSEKLTLDKLAKELHLDKYNFCKQFKKTTGRTFFDYLTFVRLKSAEELLISSEKSITEISLSCGFSTVQYFNRVFSARYGFSPTAYRKMLSNKIN